MRKLLQKLSEVLSGGGSAVLVTVAASSGSAPRGAGARMLVTAGGRAAGTIGGGIVEYDCERLAGEMLAGGSAFRLERFRLREDDPRGLGAICGGEVEVWFRAIPAGDADVLALCARAEELYGREERAWLICESGEDAGCAMAVYGAESGCAGAEVPAEALGRLPDRPAILRLGERAFFCEPLRRAGRVYIFGGGHVGQALTAALHAAEFRCVVLEDRPELCRPELFPGAEEVRLISNDDPAAYAGITDEDYVCVMTRGHRGDLTVQAQALRTPARYIGVIGSRRKKARVFASLREMGFTDADLGRIVSPIGLNIGAETPAEIAVSIAAQLIAVRSGRSAGAQSFGWDEKRERGDD